MKAEANAMTDAGMDGRDGEVEEDEPARSTRSGRDAGALEDARDAGSNRMPSAREPNPPAKAPEPIAGGEAADCDGPLAVPQAQCLPADRAEHNDARSPATLELAPSCGYIAAQLAPNDEDGYAFTPARADPVRVELAYTTSGASDLEYMIRAPDGEILTTRRDARKTPREDVVSIVQATAGARYVVSVAATSGRAACQSYALRVDPNYCTDAFEDNDEAARASKLSWDDDALATAAGTLSSNDHDFFEITTERGDPVLLTGEYRAEPDETISVRRTIYDAAGSTVTDQVGERETASETFEHWLPAKSKGSVLRVRLWPSGSGCADYQLKLDAAACTDALEDNDARENAAMLSIGRDVEVTGYADDEDHYRIESLADGGTCLLRYAVPAGRSQQLRVEVWDAAGQQITNGLGGELVGSERRLRVSWKDGRSAATLRVQPDFGGYCQPYTIRCDPPMTP